MEQGKSLSVVTFNGNRRFNGPNSGCHRRCLRWKYLHQRGLPVRLWKHLRQMKWPIRLRPWICRCSSCVSQLESADLANPKAAIRHQTFFNTVPLVLRLQRYSKEGWNFSITDAASECGQYDGVTSLNQMVKSNSNRELYAKYHTVVNFRRIVMSLNTHTNHRAWCSKRGANTQQGDSIADGLITSSKWDTTRTCDSQIDPEKSTFKWIFFTVNIAKERSTC